MRHYIFHRVLRRFPSPAVGGRALLLILLFSLALNLWNNHFPQHYHYDEPKKVRFVRDSTQDFKHPLLMLQVVRTARAAFGIEGEGPILLAGRTMSAICGMLAVLWAYLVAQNLLGSRYALFVALAVAVSPIMVVHAHYFKEDMIAICFILLSLIFLLEFIRCPGLRQTCLLGIATGLACSSQYKALLLLVLFLACPLIVPSVVRPTRAYFARIFLASGIAFIVFCLANGPLFFDFGHFRVSVSRETDYVLDGRHVRIFAPAHFFASHLLNSIAPGITPVLTLLACGYIILALVRWKTTLWQDKILISYVLLFYFTAESSPLKPSPDFMRYMIPIVPVLLYFVFALLKRTEVFFPSARAALVTGFLMVAFFPPLYETLLLDYYLVRDTRLELERWLSKNEQGVIAEQFTIAWSPPRSTVTKVWSLGGVDLEEARRSGARYALASSFAYETYLDGDAMANQSPKTYLHYERYKELFKRPYVEIKPAFKSFAFSNPTIRIIKL